MTYQVCLTATAQKEIKKKLDRGLQDRIDKKFQKLRENPKSFGKPLRFPLAGIWETYFEKRWRILYIIDDENKTVQVVGLKHKDEMATSTLF